jgi:hypothetical protein
MKRFTPQKIDIREVGGIPTPPPIILPSGDWTPHLSGYETQLLKFETNECSQISVMKCIAAYCNYLKATNQWSPAALDFWNGNGYIQSDGLFYFSEEFTAILDGTTINGNIAQNAWKCVQEYGLLPRSMLQMTLADSQQYNSEIEQDAAYYSRSRITPAMYTLASASLKFFDLWWGWVGDGTTAISLSTFQTALKTAPIQIVIPIPSPVSLWNQKNIPYTGGTDLAHCDSLYSTVMTSTYPSSIDDTYEPRLKYLADEYYIPIALQGIIIPKTPTAGGVITIPTQTWADKIISWIIGLI